MVAALSGSPAALGTVPGWERGDLVPSITTTPSTYSTRCPDRTPLARRQVLEQTFREAGEHPENLNLTLGAAEVVAAIAVVAAGLPTGGAVVQEITRHDHEVTALVIPGSDPELTGAPLAALLIAAGHDGAWHRDWTDPRTAAQARRTTDRLASVFYRDQHRHDQELPLKP